MQRTSTVGLLVVAAGLLAGCGVVEEDAPNRQEDTAARAPAPGEASGEVEREEMRTSEGLTLRTDTLAGERPYVTDGSGRALYVREAGDEPCVDACAEQWPPFTVSSGAPEAEGRGVEPALVGSVQRDGRMVQITYGGRPLFFYHADRDPGDSKGHDVHDQWGEWYLIGPDGEPVDASGEEEGD